MKSSELAAYLESQEHIQEWINIKSVLPTLLKGNFKGENVYEFNYVLDTNKKIIDSNIGVTQQPYDSIIPYHTHNYVEIIYVYNGNCSVVIEDKVFQLHQGELIFIDKNTIHKVKQINKNDIVINIALKKDYFSPSFLSRLSNHSIVSNFLIKSLVNQQSANSYLLFRQSLDVDIEMIMSNILCEYYSKQIYTHEIIESYLIILFSILIRSNTISNQPSGTKRNDTSIISFLNYIEENYQNCNLKKIADTFGFHPNYISYLLKTYTGKTFSELLKLQRVHQATILLTNTNLSISEISEEVGYSSVSFFYKKFAEVYKISPKNYRNKFSL